MEKTDILNTPHLSIKILKVNDVTEDYVRGLNDPVVNRFLEVRLKSQTLEDVREYVANNLSSATSLLLGLFTRDWSRLIGTVRLHEISPYYFTAYLGICIFDKSFHGHGLGTEAVVHTTDYAFQKLSLFAVLAPVYAENDQSAKLFKRAGFYVESQIKGRLRYDDRFVDGLIYCKKNPSFDMKKLKEQQLRNDYDYVK